MFNRGFLHIKGDVSFRDGHSGTDVRRTCSLAVFISANLPPSLRLSFLAYCLESWTPTYDRVQHGPC